MLDVGSVKTGFKFACVALLVGFVAMVSGSTPAAAEYPSVIVGHLTWQGIAQPDACNRGHTGELTICNSSISRTVQVTTDQNGKFTVITDLPNGDYTWTLKGSKNLATQGTLTIVGYAGWGEYGLQRAGDANGDNAATITDYTILRVSFGKSIGDPGYDSRTDFNCDGNVSIAEFQMLAGNYGASGAGLTCP